MLPLATLIAIGATGCIYEYQGDCFGKAKLTVVNDWSACPAAMPKGMAYIFFSEKDEPAWRFDFPGREGGEVMLLRGDYSMISYNDDTRCQIFNNAAHYSDYEISTPQVCLPEPFCTAETADTLRMPPDMMWGCAYSHVSIGFKGVQYFPAAVDSVGAVPVISSHYIITARQTPLTARYHVIIDDVKNLGGVQNLTATLSGMAGSLSPATEEKGLYPATLLLDVSKTGNERIEGLFYTFGIPRNPEHANELCLYAILHDKRRFCYSFDLTPQVRTASDPMNVTLYINGLSIEKSDTETGAFDVSVDGWQKVIVNING